MNELIRKCIQIEEQLAAIICVYHKSQKKELFALP